MPYAEARGARLFYETMGDDDGVPVLLVAGLGAQCISWADDFCLGLVDRGFLTIRMDNRDSGYSTTFDAFPADGPAFLEAVAEGRSAYRLSDMAQDCVAVLDAVGLPAAHVVGRSLGGMVAQVVAIEHPDRLLSLTSIMSTTGEPGVGQPLPHIVELMSQPTPTGTEAAIAQAVELMRAYSGPDYFEEDTATDYQRRAHERGTHPSGTARQLLAVIASGSRAEGLAALRAPTLVIHGDLDPLVPLDGGQRTAELVPGAELLVIEGMGHDLPAPLWAPIIEAITRQAAAVGVAEAQ